MTLGQSIKYLRQARGLSQAELAERVAISASYLSLVEGDKRDASIPLLRKMGDLLGTPAFLFFAYALAGERQDPVARQAHKLLDDLTELVGARGIALDLKPHSSDD